MSHSIHPLSVLRVQTGLVLLILSAGLLFLLIPLAITWSIKGRQDVLIIQEKTRHLQRDYARQREESESLNKAVVQAHQQIRELAGASEWNTRAINRLMDQALTSKESRDSIELLYEKQVIVLEPKMDSLQQVFSVLTGQMVSVLQILYLQEKDLNISRHEEKKYASVARVWMVTTGVALLSFLLLSAFSVRQLIRGFRSINEEIRPTG